MKVLLATQEFPPETHWGGLATYFDALASALAGVGAEVHVLSVVRHQEPSDRVRPDGVHVHRRALRRLPGVGRATGLHLSWERVSLARAVAREYEALVEATGSDFDVVETAGWGAECRALAGAGRVPVAVHVFSSAVEIFPMLGRIGVDRRLGIHLERSMVRRANLVLGTPAQLGKVAGELGLAPEACWQIRCPVTPLPLAEPFAGPPTIFFAGRFEPRKGPETLVRALPAVRRAVPDARLVLRGRDSSDLTHPSWIAHLRQLAAELGVADAVEIVERWGEYQEVLDGMAASTVVAMPSRWESFGYVAAEAASMGRPVVASSIPALSDLVADGVTGRLAPPDDPDAWAEALVDVLADPARASALGAAGAERIRDICDPATVAEDTIRAYVHAAARFRAGLDAMGRGSTADRRPAGPATATGPADPADPADPAGGGPAPVAAGPVPTSAAR